MSHDRNIQTPWQYWRGLEGALKGTVEARPVFTYSSLGVECFGRK